MKGFYKVPFRDVYSDTLKYWLLATIWCHVVCRLYPGAYDWCSSEELHHALGQIACPSTLCCENEDHGNAS